MHKYAIQITVADARDGALSGSTLKEASSWGKVDLTYEQMVFSEATLALPLIARLRLPQEELCWSLRKAICRNSRQGSRLELTNQIGKGT